MNEHLLQRLRRMCERVERRLLLGNGGIILYYTKKRGKEGIEGEVDHRKKSFFPVPVVWGQR